MTQLAYFYRRYGAWVFAAGVFAFLVGFSYRTSVAGILTLIVGLLVAASDPAVLFLGVRQGLEKPKATLVGAWILGVLGLSFYLGRALIEVAPDAVGGEESMAARVRALLLALFLLALAASFAFRLAVSLGASAVDGLKGGARATRESFLRSSVLAVVAALPLFVLINYVSAVRNPTLDMSPGYYSFGEASRTIIKTLNKDVQVYAFLPVQQAVRDAGKGSTRPELFKIAEDVRVMLEQLPVTNSRISLTFLNADLDAEKSAEFGTVANGTILLRVMKPAEAVVSGDKP
ncbi:MAG: hypothetical protein HY042_06170, partial [Spirochaetia bacterium]|nr:hypothetical protein [Spirochaetia bacterium]